MLIVNKFNSFSASILKNTNRLVCSSQYNLGGIGQGSYLKIGDDEILYQVLESKKFYYTKNFEVINNRTLKIKSNTDVNLQREDSIKVIFDEYELGIVLSIINPGGYYKEGEILTVKGGELSVDISSGIGSPTKLKVEELGDFSSVTKLTLESKGRYTVPPQGKIETYGGSGENLVLELEYRPIDNKNIQERVIKKVDFIDGETILTLDYSLPLGIKGGNLATEKWEIFLYSNYLSESTFNVNCTNFRDFTPHLKLPLISKNSLTFDLLVNKSLFTMDTKIKKLEEEIELLKKRNR